MRNLGLIYKIDLPTFFAPQEANVCSTGDLLTPKKGGKHKQQIFAIFEFLGETQIGKSIDPAVGILATTKREWRSKRWNRTWLIDPVRMLGAESLGKLGEFGGD